MNARLPLIGVTLDGEPPAPQGTGGYSCFPWYAIRQNYMDMIAACGGLPVALGHDPALAARMVSRLDGLVVTGGAFDVPPDLYGATEAHASVRTKPRRTAAEAALVRAALAKGIPILGICGGMQLLAVLLGGTLVQHIPDALAHALAHEQPNPRDEAGHDVYIMADTHLARLVGADCLPVNSSHHQAVHDTGRGIVCARAPDGVIEALELPGHPFCIGVQWHPEFGISAGDRLLFEGLIDAARQAGT
ncbi:gamma-glutamyl-gamma-aminobutyrate hydrolase [Komagataeibacter rhaeticus]|uniref:gamma-glutamyl-gamma-aminobutyrate hydrolase family protein n=1 Tax=Komagataeibacter rhaeticus TaxID=215221 RepID=UPI0004DAE732|nr:gamma-glutamyl-gamma-aminobutyrate hydrolase family protein [Komagataeibacter rhaeticus]KDU96219.1 glutamine amidotransferase [Komagataeibacter rhaeticus AF1]MBL7239065.1 gamma-glutamyl-gamma-aminobutyrate hydrolase family protein [Komagataeibacter rhaeticus]PYD54965.1 gamma-glutamyl-gamma-aminobutyrate hydrolase [Komagataeibacter rhaeticus]GBQ13980.1 glutamine amidotransferase-like protein [Komagataeibacter rhaeticus DSM 16663]